MDDFSDVKILHRHRTWDNDSDDSLINDGMINRHNELPKQEAGEEKVAKKVRTT